MKFTLVIEQVEKGSIGDKAGLRVGEARLGTGRSVRIARDESSDRLVLNRGARDLDDLRAVAGRRDEDRGPFPAVPTTCPRRLGASGAARRAAVPAVS